MVLFLGDLLDEGSTGPPEDYPVALARFYRVFKGAQRSLVSAYFIYYLLFIKVLLAA